jgi:hypothetical protein
MKTHQPVHDAAEIDAHDPVVVVAGCLIGRTEHADASIVDQNTHLAECPLDVSGGLHHRAVVGHVELEGKNLCPLPAGLEMRQRRREMILAPIGDRDLHPFVGECLGDAEPDAADAAGDERALVLEVLHVDRARFPSTIRNDSVP